jgi:alkylation response protein AidB-like acyl-CoA dehydrogenase
MLVRSEVARSAVYAAACALDGASDDDPAVAVSAAKVVAGEAALANGRAGIQVHGGMGFTWEVHAQRYWKRAVTLDATFGTADTHALRVADAL